MKEENKSRSLQSRREFFKSAAKAALPIVGAVVLSQLPVKMQAANGCNDGCSYSCQTSCQRECRGYCKYGCQTTCSGSCSGSSKK